MIPQCQVGRRRWPSLVQYDDDRAVVGFGGLTIRPTKHRFEVAGRTLYTWCAWDSLFIPEILGQTARVESSCPESGNAIEITISPNAAPAADPPGTVVSFPLPEAAQLRADVRSNFCDLVYFFSSRDAAEVWTRRHEETFVLSLAQAVELGQQKNKLQFGDVLTHAASASTINS